MDNTLTTRILDGPLPRLELATAILEVISGPDAGARLELGLDSVIIGTHATCDLVLTDSTVSARHARIEVGDGRMVLRDLGSKNGVKIAGADIYTAPLADGLVFAVGKTECRIEHKGKEERELGAPRQLGRIVAHSVKMRAALSQLERLAESEITVLLEGETGTGKDRMAQALHDAGPRRDGPFVVFDCGAQSPGLISSGLFGHEKGAFTGADVARDGALVAANGGTIFFDEIGELPLELQPMLLRVLETRTVRRVGSTEATSVDVRFVAATNRNLEHEVREGRFREDLLYRVAVGRVRVPPLRERREDIPFLVREFAANVGATISPDLMEMFVAYDWPGNVRELMHTVSRASISADPSFVAPNMLAAATPEDLQPLQDARRLANDEFERAYVARALELSGGNVSAAARLAGVSRQLLTRLISKHGLREPV